MGLKDLQTKMGIAISNRLKEESTTPLMENESVLYHEVSTKFTKLALFTSGTLTITNKRIIFEGSSKLNLTTKSKNAADIIMNKDVIGYGKANMVMLGMMVSIPGYNKDRTILIKTESDTYQFGPEGNLDDFINIIKENCVNAKLLEKETYIDSLKGSLAGRHQTDTHIKGDQKGSSLDEEQKEIICSNCGQINENGKKFCCECGTPLKLICPACGCDLKNGVKFCSECGTKL